MNRHAVHAFINELLQAKQQKRSYDYQTAFARMKWYSEIDRTGRKDPPDDARVEAMK